MQLSLTASPFINWQINIHSKPYSSPAPDAQHPQETGRRNVQDSGSTIQRNATNSEMNAFLVDSRNVRNA